MLVLYTSVRVATINYVHIQNRRPFSLTVVRVLTISALVAIAIIALFWLSISDVWNSTAADVVPGGNSAESAYVSLTSEQTTFSIPANGFVASQQAQGQRWLPEKDSKGKVTGFVHIQPPVDEIRDSGYAGRSPRLDYSVNFKKRGIYYVWIHGAGASGESSIHVGLNGSSLHSSDRITGFGTIWASIQLAYSLANSPSDMVQ